MLLVILGICSKEELEDDELLSSGTKSPGTPRRIKILDKYNN
jgi:hypothetical protein